MGLVAARVDFEPATWSRPLKVGFLTPHNPFDPGAFSGTAQAAWHALNRQAELDVRLLGSHRPQGFRDRLGRKLGRGVPPAFSVSPRETRDLDVVIGLVATRLLDHLPNGVPFLHVTDATPRFIEEYYACEVDPQAHQREIRVARRAARVVYSSAEMASRGQAELSALGQIRTAAVPFGVNLDPIPLFSRPRAVQGFRMLTVITNWTRKGGGIALDALRLLRAGGLDATMTVVGDMPSEYRKEPGLNHVGWLDKSKKRDLRRLSRLYREADVFVLPTRADCTPMVLAEAMAHGMPVLATDVGGIPSQVPPGTGRLLPLSASADDWASELLHLANAPDECAMMADAGRDRAATVLSWTTWARELTRLARAAAAEAATERSHPAPDVLVHS